MLTPEIENVFGGLRPPQTHLVSVYDFEIIIVQILDSPSENIENKGFFDHPERVMVLWLNRLSLEDFIWYFPNPQCQIVRVYTYGPRQQAKVQFFF